MFTPGQKPSAPATSATQTSPLLRAEPQVATISLESDSGGGLPREISAFELRDEVEGVK